MALPAPTDLSSLFASAFANALNPTAPGAATPPAVPPPVAAPAPAPIQQNDPAALLRALAPILHPDVLGAVARGNSRPSGLTPGADWASMFAPISADRQAQMQNHTFLTPLQVHQQMQQVGQHLVNPPGTVTDTGVQPTQSSGVRTNYADGSATMPVDRRYQTPGAPTVGSFTPAHHAALSNLLSLFSV